MWRTLKILHDELFFWFGLSILWWVGILLVIPAAPVTAGLCAVANCSANYKRVDAELFWDHAKSNIKRSCLLVGTDLILIAVVVMNIMFYGSSSSTLARVVVIPLLWLIVLLLIGSQYLLPLVSHQENSSLFLTFRNAFLVALRYPLFSLLMLIFQIALVVMSIVTVLPFFLLMPASVAVAANVGLVTILQDMDLIPTPPRM